MKKKMLLSLLLLFTACAQKGADAPRSDSAPISKQKLKVETIATGLEFPWGIAFLPDNSALITERPGRLRLLKDGKLSAPINGVPVVFYDGQGGLLDVAVHPDFAQNNLIYLSFSKGDDKDNATTLIRAKLGKDKLENIETIFEASPHKKDSAHFSGRILFLPDKTLLLSVGDGFSYKEEAQNPKSDLGKIIQMNDDGKNVHHFSMGHRNSQGLAFDRANNIIYQHEHGPRGGDEINILEKNKNYGWPKITYGIDYSGLKISDYVAMPGLEQPLLYWVPSIAPSAMVFYDKSLFKDWSGDLFVTALAGQQLRRVDLNGNKPIAQEILLSDMNTRFRNIAIATDGSLWILTDEPEAKVLRLSPQ